MRRTPAATPIPTPAAAPELIEELVDDDETVGEGDEAGEEGDEAGEGEDVGVEVVCEVELFVVGFLSWLHITGGLLSSIVRPKLPLIRYGGPTR